MSADRFDGRAPFRPHPPVVLGVCVRTGIVVIALSLVLWVIVLPGLGDFLAETSPGALIGVLVLASTGVRVVAGVFGARLLRRRYGLTGRAEALASVAVGTAVAWVAYVVLITALGGSGDPFWRLLLELPRWIGEAGVGALLVAPGEAEAQDPALRRFAASRAPR